MVPIIAAKEDSAANVLPEWKPRRPTDKGRNAHLSSLCFFLEASWLNLPTVTYSDQIFACFYFLN